MFVCFVWGCFNARAIGMPFSWGLQFTRCFPHRPVSLLTFQPQRLRPSLFYRQGQRVLRVTCPGLGSKAAVPGWAGSRCWALPSVLLSLSLAPVSAEAHSERVSSHLPCQRPADQALQGALLSPQCQAQSCLDVSFRVSLQGGLLTQCMILTHHGLQL